MLHNVIKCKFALDPSLYAGPLSAKCTHCDDPYTQTLIYARTDTYKFSLFPWTIS